MLLQNAINSIRLGIGDYKSGSTERLLSAARNLSSGMLLLFKEKLRRLSPPNSNDVLIKSRIIPVMDKDGNVKFIGENNNTINKAQIKNYFKSLKIDVDWKKVDEIIDLRNNIEHYYSNINHNQIKQILANVFIIFDKFIPAYLDDTPAGLFGKKYWDVIVQEADTFKYLLKECQREFDKIICDKNILNLIYNIDCPICGSHLVKNEFIGEFDPYNAIFSCMSCSNKFQYEEVVEETCNKLFGALDHINIKDGGDPIIHTCHVCGKHTFYLEKDICLNCGESLYYHECERCGEQLSTCEQDNGGLCSYCAYILSKDD